MQIILEEEIREHKVTSKLLSDTFTKYQETKKELLYFQKQEHNAKTRSKVKIAHSEFVLEQIASFVGYQPSEQ